MANNDIPGMPQIEGELDDLVIRAQSGDRDSLGEIFERLQGRIYRFLRGRVSDDEIAADLTQTTFIEMIHALPRYKKYRDAKFSTWLFQIARFRLIDHYRKQGRTVSLDLIAEQADDQPDYADPIVDARVERALRTLPENYQTILHLRYREDLSTKDIARIMKTSTMNVRVLHHRAVKALRTALPPMS